MKRLLTFALLAAAPVCAQEVEGYANCAAKKIVGCATALFTEHPFHIGVSTLAPGNGFAVGPAVTFTKHPVEKSEPGQNKYERTVRPWRINFDADLAVSFNRSWRAGAYLKARYTPESQIVKQQGLSTANLDLRPKSWLFSAYAETESLRKLTFYGVGANTSRSNLTYYGMTETIIGGNALIPVWSRIGLKAFGEANTRIVKIRANHDEGGPSIEQVFTPASTLDVGNTRAYGQLGEGLRMDLDITRHVQLNYAITLQEFHGSQNASFERLTTDIRNTFPIWGTTRVDTTQMNGPNTCAKVQSSNCPVVSRNYEGSFGLRFVSTDSFASSTSHVPFYFQPTIGGSDINGDNFLPSYPDYRFRAPNMMVVRESFDHSLGKWPVGAIFFADQGRVAGTRDFSGSPWLHSFAAGLSIRAGGLPVLSVLFAWGGGEGTHTLAQVNSSLLGGGARPSLF